MKSTVKKKKRHRGEREIGLTAQAYSRGSSSPRDQALTPSISCLGKRIPSYWAQGEQRCGPTKCGLQRPGAGQATTVLGTSRAGQMLA